MPTSKVVGDPTYHRPSDRFENAEQSIVLDCASCAKAALMRAIGGNRMQAIFFGMAWTTNEGRHHMLRHSLRANKLPKVGGKPFWSIATYSDNLLALSECR